MIDDDIRALRTALVGRPTPGPLYIRTNRHPTTDGRPWGWLDTKPPGAGQEPIPGVQLRGSGAQDQRRTPATSPLAPPTASNGYWQNWSACAPSLPSSASLPRRSGVARQSKRRKNSPSHTSDRFYRNSYYNTFKCLSSWNFCSLEKYIVNKHKNFWLAMQAFSKYNILYTLKRIINEQ